MATLLLAVIYLSFISLGLPDALLGAAWPSMYHAFSVPVSCAGIISMIIAAGTIVSSLMSDRLTRCLGTGRVTACSVAVTAAALYGFSASSSFPALCVWAVPYGLGAGSVDASLNNCVALHFKSRHMSWLHCMWGIGASAGPSIMGMALTNGRGWQAGYRSIAVLQFILTAVLIVSLPLWKKQAWDNRAQGSSADVSPLTLPDIFRLRGAKEIMIAFFCYSAVEQTTGLWAASYLVLHSGFTAEAAAGYAAMFYIGITVGRGVSGFLTFKLSDTQMIRLGQGIIAVGISMLLLPFSQGPAVVGLVLIGLGCAPIYPSIIHSTPDHFGAEHSQAVIGVQMASAYVGTCLMPPLFGLLAQQISPSLLPIYLLLVLVLMAWSHERLCRCTDDTAGERISGNAD